MSVYTPLLGILWRTLEAYGIDPRRVIDEVHYRPGERSLMSRRVSFADYDAAISRATELIDDPAIGIRSAQFLHPSHLGALGLAWLTSPSLRMALRLGQRFRHMYNQQVEIQLLELRDCVRVIYDLSEQPARPDEMADAQLAGMLTMCRMNFGPALMPLSVKLKRLRPANPAPWLECFGDVVLFGQHENSLSISSADADRLLTGSNPELAAVNQEFVERYVLQLDQQDILSRIRLGLMERLPSGRVTEDDMASMLNMSQHTLQRRLREHGETFRSLLAQVRIDLAERYVRGRDLSMTEIAFLLGYNDTSAFSRAFRSWFGMSPTQAREQEGAA